MIGDVYPIEEMLADGISPILTKTEIEYRLPVRFGEDVTGSMWVNDLGSTRWTVEAKIRVGDQLRTHARQQGYFADANTLRPIRIPSHLRDIWQPKPQISVGARRLGCAFEDIQELPHQPFRPLLKR